MADRGAIRLRVANMGKSALASKNCQNATAYKPRTMQAAKLPFIFTQRGRGQYPLTHGDGEFAEILSLELVIVIAQATLGLVGQAEEEADTCFTLVQDYLKARDVTTLDGTYDTEQLLVEMSGDQGVRQITFEDTAYYAAVINVLVKHERSVKYLGV